MEDSKMEASVLDSATWEHIDLAESYLVSGMFEEASELASSILTHLRDNQNAYTEDDILWLDMMESSAMVLVQSWRGTGRISDLLDELKCYFGSMTEIPVQAVLTGACVQVSGGHSSGVRVFLEDFLSKWQLKDEKYYFLSCQDVQKNEVLASVRRSTLEVDQYLKVVEFYALTLLGEVLNDIEFAVSWVEKAQLPDEARQDLCRRLLSLYPLKSSSSSQRDVSLSTAEEPESRPLSVKEVKQSDKSMIFLSSQYCNGGVDTKCSIWVRLKNMSSCSCKSVVASKGKIFFGCLIFLSWYYIRKERENINRIVRRRVLSMKKALVDFWKLAFSYQVNPLAAVQPLPASTNRIM